MPEILYLVELPTHSEECPSYALRGLGAGNIIAGPFERPQAEAALVGAYAARGYVECPRCEGHGETADYYGEIGDCGACRAEGFVERPSLSGGSFFDRLDLDNAAADEVRDELRAARAEYVDRYEAPEVRGAYGTDPF